MTALMPQLAESLDALWAGLPTSNVFKQKKLAGLREGGEEQRRVLDAKDEPVVLLAAYHLTLQWYLDDVESLIGCCVAEATSTLVRASYVYAEDEDPVAQVLAEVARQWHDGRAASLTPGEPVAWDEKRTPLFFYAAGAADLEALRGRIVLAAGAEVAVSMPGGVSEALAIDELARRYETVLRALATAGDASVGELRARLGETADVPYRRLEEMQRRVIDLWSRVLSIPPETLDATSSYFEVGGTSLNAFKLVNRVRVEHQRDISMRDIIDNPTIQEFARLLLRD